MTEPTGDRCAAVLEDLALIVDGNEDALDRHGDHLAECDRCRDATHDARAAARVVVEAGRDYEPPDDLEARVLAALDAEDANAGGEPGAKAPVAVAVVGGGKDAAARAHEAAPRPDAPESRDRPATSGGRGRWLLVAAAALLALAGGVGIWMSRTEKDEPESGAVAAGRGESSGTGAAVAQIVRAAADGETGLTVRAHGAAAFGPATAETELAPGTTVRTDERTRARLELGDGTVLVLNHGTELTLDRDTPRLVRMAGGEVLAEVARLEGGTNAVFETPTGRVEVLGTKLVVTATDEVASVRVTRGHVRIHGGSGGEAEVKAGEEGLMSRDGGMSVAPAVDLAGAVRWSELDPGPDSPELTMSGIGQLRAKRPGEREEQERPLALASHKVRVRIVGNVARTEVEEVFRNDSGDTLEGIFAFPLPPDARIARLALDVDGVLEEGAFVERDRAAKIWRGVIRRATPEPQRQIAQPEFIWVPGPWRDPALLEWQRGGRFELRIFPIPARGDRRVVIAYDQTVQPHGATRRYVYPLPHSADASTRIGRFDLDVRVAGADPAHLVASHGYGMQTSREGEATRLTYAQEGFLPAGDVVIDYALPNPDSEIRWWTFQGAVAAAPTVEARGGGRGSSPEVVDAQRAVAADQRPFVAFAIRPELPGRAEARRQDLVLVVDSSQSMVGESFARASALVTGIVAEMDRRDRFTLLACDATCQHLPGGLTTPSSQAAAEVRDWLGRIRPAGSSDLVATLRAAASVTDSGPDSGREVRVVYVGDGNASVGPRRAAAIAAVTRSLASGGGALFTTVGIGGEADAMVLGAIARAGGGHYVPFVPGQRATATALSVLETTYGVALQGATLEMPEGVVDLAPAELPTIRAGEEVVVVGRFAGPVRGEVVIRGTVGGEPYVDRYPVELTASTAAGNAFVPRLWAAATIADRELSGRGEDLTRVVALSRAFGVMSRHTSLLVLESEAMFQAFGLDRARPAVEWTGEDDLDENEATGTVAQEPATVLGGLGMRGGGAAGPVPSSRASTGSVLGGDLDRVTAAEAAPSRDVLSGAMDEERQRASRRAPPSAPGRGSWMRRVWERVGSVSPGPEPLARDEQAVAEAEQALHLAPDSRDRHRDLYRALARAGHLDRALEVAERWIVRDQLDPEALVALADVLGRQGRRDEAARILTGVVDLRPDDKTLHQRLAEAFDRAGLGARACSHRVAIAEIEQSDPVAVGAALRCGRALGDGLLADQILQALADASARQRAERAATTPPRERPVRGDLMVEASWNGPQDLDISLVNPQGARISWMGGRTNVVGEAARAPGRETLGLRFTPVGSYVVEVSRTDPSDRLPVSGQLRIRALGQTRTVPFVLTDDRAAVARVTVRREARMVPAW